jgi:hypothetical protein
MESTRYIRQRNSLRGCPTDHTESELLVTYIQTSSNDTRLPCCLLHMNFLLTRREFTLDWTGDSKNDRNAYNGVCSVLLLPAFPPINTRSINHVNAVTSNKPLQHRTATALFSCKKFCKFFQYSPSHRIFRRMHEALNIDKKIKLITQFRWNGRDESFKPN